MATPVKPRGSRASIERVKPAGRPAASASVVPIEEEYHVPGTTARAAPPYRGLVFVQAVGPSPRKIGVWAALMAKLLGPAATRRQLTRQEAYQEWLRGYGTLTSATWPRC